MAIETVTSQVEQGGFELAASPHARFDEGEFWRAVPGYSDVDEATFLDHTWQARHSVTKLKHLRAALGDRVGEAFYADVERAFHLAPMSLRVSPYVISLIDWDNPYDDPLRIQFIPVASRLIPDHPELDLDSLHEQEDSPVPGLTHRYPDKALFLSLDTCPVYCRFCTRSYAVGGDTEEVEKVSLKVNATRWDQMFDYIRSQPLLEDIVISGGDVYNLRPEHIELIGMTLLAMPNIQRIRYATKGIAIMPQKILTHPEWVDALTRVVEEGRRRHKDVCVHTHFNHPAEITWISQRASYILQERGITVRNQTVLQRGVNDAPETMKLLVRRLGYINIRPYYVYLCDMVKGVEDLRTPVSTAVELEKFVRGSTAGYNTPAFVCDAPGGGGKRDIHSFELYDRENGITVYSAPSVKAGQLFVYFDPVASLSAEAQERWADPKAREAMIAAALAEVRGRS